MVTISLVAPPVHVGNGVALKKQTGAGSELWQAVAVAVHGRQLSVRLGIGLLNIHTFLPNVKLTGGVFAVPSNLWFAFSIYFHHEGHEEHEG